MQRLKILLMMVFLSLMTIGWSGVTHAAGSITSGSERLTVIADLGYEATVSTFAIAGKGQYYDLIFYNKDNRQTWIRNTPETPGTLGSSSSTSAFTVRYIKIVLAPNSTITGMTFGPSSHGNTISDFEALAPPVAPTGLTGTAGNATVSLSWTVVSGAKSYDVYVDGVKSKTVTTSSTSFTGLTNDREYSFYLKAINDQGESSASMAIRLTPKAPPPPPPPPDTTPPTVPVISGKPGKGQAILTWTRSPESDLAGYNLYQDGSKVGNYTTNGATVSGLKNGTEYKFQVTSVDTTGNESAKSNQIAVTPVEKMDVNLIPNGDSIVVQIVSGGTGPYVINWGAAQKTVDQSQYVIQNLQFDTEYTVTITDANGLTYTSKINTGTEKGYIPPTFPNPQNLFQRMIDSFSTAGSIGIAVISGAVALGLLVLLAYWGWLLLKRWIARTK